MPAAGRPPRSILVVEDDDGMRAFLVAVLELQGHTVIATENAENALRLLDDQVAQLAVLDIGLPGMDGFAVADRLGEHVPVIIVTGDPVHAYAQARVRSLSYQVLPKPVTPELLEHAVAAAL
jgi:DNA-binding NtrC family response regulator